MNSTVIDPRVESLLARLDSVLDELSTVPVDTLTDDDLLALLRRLETAKRRLPSVDHRLIAQMQTRSLDYRHGAKSLPVFLAQLLRIRPTEATARVRAAQAAGPRTALTGEQLPPIYPEVAAAQAAGDLSAEHARVIVSMIDRLPGAVAAELGNTLETMLVGQARVLDPTQLGQHAVDLSRVLDPDGAHRDTLYRDRCRELRLAIRADGSSHLVGDLTAECTEHVRTMLDTLARPKPEADGIKDQRSYPQRCHDAVLDVLLMAERSGQLPDAGGVTTTIILTFDADDYANGTGVARTGHGVTVATEDAKTWAGDTRVIGLVLDKMRAVTHYSSSQRLFTENQRLVMAGRDGGCAFPGCDSPPQQCEAHHMIEHQDGGPTSTDNGCLLCSYHHRSFEAMGWTGQMINGTPHFVPPRWLDHQQTPRRNAMHDSAPNLVPT